MTTMRVLIVLLFAVAAAAQTREEITVEVVDVPISVSRGGKPVEGLTRDRFELFVNGKPQPIEYFDILGADEIPTGAVTQRMELRARRLFLLVFDLPFTVQGSVARGQQAGAEFARRAQPGDLIGVAVFSSTKGLQILTPFTTDRVLTAKAIRDLTSAAMADPLHIAASVADRSFMEPAFMDENVLPPEAYYDPQPSARLWGEANRSIQRTHAQRAVEHEITELATLGGRLAGIEGQKHVVFFSEGFSATLVHDLDRERMTAPAADPHLMQLLEEMYRRYQVSDVFLHAIDTRGLRSPHYAKDPLANDALFLLASGTGGEVIRNRSDLGAALHDLAVMRRTGYLLGFKPAAARTGFNRISVKIRGLDRGTEVSHRLGFSGEPPARNVRDPLVLADIVQHDVPQTGLACGLEISDGLVKITVPAGEIAAQLGGAGEAMVLVYLFDERGLAVGFRNLLLNIQPGTSGVRRYAVPLPDGARVAKSLLLVGQSVGFTRTN